MSIEFLKIFENIGRIQIKSITDQIFRYGLLLLSLGVTSAFLKNGEVITYIIIGLGVLLILVGVIFYIYFAKKAPEFLRSESFQLKKQSIELLGDKDKTLSQNISSLPLIMSSFSEDDEHPVTKKIENGE